MSLRIFLVIHLSSANFWLFFVSSKLIDNYLFEIMQWFNHSLTYFFVLIFKIFHWCWIPDVVIIYLYMFMSDFFSWFADISCFCIFLINYGGLYQIMKSLKWAHPNKMSFDSLKSVDFKCYFRAPGRTVWSS
jgi:hypothetical protein